MALQQITLRLPKETLREFDRVAARRRQARETVLVQLVEEFVQRVGQQQEIARLTLAALGIKPPRTRHGRSFNTRKVARALKRTYGTDDAVKIVNMNRNRWSVHQ